MIEYAPKSNHIKSVIHAFTHSLSSRCTLPPLNPLKKRLGQLQQGKLHSHILPTRISNIRLLMKNNIIILIQDVKESRCLNNIGGMRLDQYLT